MNKYLIAIIVLISFNYSFAQSTKLSGHFIDKETNKPISYATIEIFSLKIGTIADKNGVFELTVDSKDINLDTIEFSNLGYEKIKLSIGDFLKLENHTISIRQQPIKLDEVVIIPKKYKIVKLGITNKKFQSKQITNLYNNKIGNYIENKKSKMGWVNSVSFYIHKDGHPETPFRVRIYAVNKEKRRPGKDILNENLVVSAGKPGWFTVDLTKYNIPFPIDGIFVMMEWINSGDQYFYELEMPIKNKNGEFIKEKRKFYGQTIGSILSQPQMITWGVTLGMDWIPYDLFGKGYINAMINAEIAYPLD
jgi:hypothetical protein